MKFATRWRYGSVWRRRRQAHRRRGALHGERLEDRRLLTVGWATQAGGLADEAPLAVAARPDGSALAVTGWFRGEASFGSRTLVAAAPVASDLFVAGVRPDGSYAWATRAGGTEADQGRDVAALDDGSFLVVGETGGAARFGSIAVEHAGGFVAKIDAAGSFVWSSVVAHTRIAAIASLADGSAVVTGTFTGTASFGSTTLVSAGGEDFFVAKVDGDGSFAWAIGGGGQSDDLGIDIAALADGSALVLGTVSGSATVGSIVSDGGLGNAFVAKVTSTGAVAWLSRTAGEFSFSGGIAARADGSAIVTGSFRGTATFGGTTLTSAGSWDAFIGMLNPDGSPAWAIMASGPGDDGGVSVAALADGSAVVTGTFFLTVSIGGVTVTGAGVDIFVAKVHPDGTCAWVTRMGGPANDRGSGIAALADRSAVVVGTFGDALTWGGTTLSGFGDTQSIVMALVPASGSPAEPRAPADLLATAGDTTVELSWTPPSETGGAVVRDYLVYSSGNGGDTWALFDDGVSTTPAASVTGLVNGTRYLLRVAAVTAADVVLPAATYAFVTPRGLASPPAVTAPVPGDNLASLAWSTPAFDGGSAIIDYRIEYSTDEGRSWTGFEDGVSPLTRAVVTGLTNAVGHVFRVAAVTSAGTGVFSTPSAVTTPARAWPRQGGGNDADAGERTVALADGSLLVAGTFQGDTALFRGGLRSRGGDDAFIAKLNRNGLYEWTTQVGGPGDDYVTGLAEHADGSIVVSGYFSGSATFGGQTLTSAGGYDAFVAKLTRDGAVAWAIRSGGPEDDYGNNVAVFADGSAIVTGSFQGAAAFGSTFLTGRGHRDIFVVKVSAAGVREWVRHVGGTGDEWGYGIATASDGSTIVAGGLFGQVAFGETTLSSDNYDLFVAKLAADGTWAWATRGGGADYDEGSGVSALADGSVLVAGSTYGSTATFGTTTLAGAGLYDAFVTKLNPDGSYAWATRVGGPADDRGFGISALPDGAAILTGSFQRTAAFGDTVLTSDSDSPDVYVAKVNPDGTHAWAVRAGGAGVDQGFGVATFPDGLAVLTGSFASGSSERSATFGNRLLVSRGGEDMFVATIGPTGVFGMLPDPPTGLQAIPGGDAVTLAWTAAADAGRDAIVDYLIELRAADDPLWTTVVEPVSATTTASVAALVPGTNYLFRVAAANGVGRSGFTSPVAAQVAIPNRPPVAVALAATSLAENLPPGTPVGAFTAIDPDEDATFTYSLVSGEEFPDNGSFTISGDTLHTTAAFDHETKSSHTIRIRATDTGGLFIDQTFTIAVTDVGPAALQFRAATDPGGVTAAEATAGLITIANAVAGGTITVTVRGTFGSVTHAVPGTGAAEQPFALTTADLATLGDGPATVTVRQVDATGESSPVTPLDLILDTVAPAMPTFALVADTGPDPSDGISSDGRVAVAGIEAGATWSYSTDAGSTWSGGGSGGGFTLSRGAYPAATVRVRQTDAAGNVGSVRANAAAFAIRTAAPSAILLSSSVLPENRPAGSVVGMLTAIDADPEDAFRYTLVPGAGAGDNAWFTIDAGDNRLRTTAAFDFETRRSYAIRIAVTDRAGLTHEATFTVAITDVVEPLGVVAVIPPAQGSYRSGAVLRYTVVTTDPVRVVGRPTVDLRVGATTRVATLESAVGNRLVFAYRVVAGDHDPDGIELGAAINRLPSGASIRDARGRNLPLRLPAVNSAQVWIDTKPPVTVGQVLTPQAGTYRPGATLGFRVTFNEPVLVVGVPQLPVTFNTSAVTKPARHARYVSGSGSRQLVFQYVVQPGDAAPQGIGVSPAIMLGLGGSIRDVAGNGAALAVRIPSTSGVRIDGSPVAAKRLSATGPIA